MSARLGTLLRRFREEREEDGCLCATGAERRMYGVKAAFAMLRAVKLGASFFEAYR